LNSKLLEVGHRLCNNILNVTNVTSQHHIAQQLNAY